MGRLLGNPLILQIALNHPMPQGHMDFGPFNLTFDVCGRIFLRTYAIGEEVCWLKIIDAISNESVFGDQNNDADMEALAFDTIEEPCKVSNKYFTLQFVMLYNLSQKNLILVWDQLLNDLAQKMVQTKILEVS